MVGFQFAKSYFVIHENKFPATFPAFWMDVIFVEARIKQQ